MASTPSTSSDCRSPTLPQNPAVQSPPLTSASSSSSTTSLLSNNNLTQVVSVKLTNENFLFGRNNFFLFFALKSSFNMLILLFRPLPLIFWTPKLIWLPLILYLNNGRVLIRPFLVCYKLPFLTPFFLKLQLLPPLTNFIATWSPRLILKSLLAVINYASNYKQSNDMPSLSLNILLKFALLLMLSPLPLNLLLILNLYAIPYMALVLTMKALSLPLRRVKHYPPLINSFLYFLIMKPV
ncbi:hypothetical protein BVC80_1421g19 [Macleaya cordata]|uniref:Uncharacterized protein n=1 Tax=Macleaya cordata TaxID=56857 RepID=A0A200Q8Q7_MACCD|nr:hypothetical protein BVC80_1421g19 [Macleaya cordata]